MNGLIEFWMEKYYRDSKLEGKTDRMISLGISERTLRRKKKKFSRILRRVDL